MKLLAVGDIHLGRRPSRLPKDLASSARELSPSAAWQRTVKFAVEERVDAVLLAGDVVESEKDFFEGFRELKSGVDRLAAAGIQVIAVAGNHDVLVLPRLADLFEEGSGFKLLGRGGKWESWPIKAKGDIATLWGWSFPQASVSRSPLVGANFKGASGLQIGLLHCDRDQARSLYAPVSSRELESSALDNWLLGHIHQPDALGTDALCGYLGCLSGMDPGEPGPRGPWMLGIERGRVREVEQIPLAPLRWERMQVDVGKLEDPTHIEPLIIAKTKELDEALAQAPHSPIAVGLRVTFVGHTVFATELSSWIERADGIHTSFQQGSRQYFVEHYESAVLPRIDLEDLAKRSDPLGLLAQHVLILHREAGDPERRALVRETTDRFKDSLNHANWHDLETNDSELQAESVAARLKHAGMQAINALWAQHAGPGT